MRVMCFFFLERIVSATQSKAEAMAAEAKGRSAYSHNEILLPHNLLPLTSPWPAHLATPTHSNYTRFSPRPTAYTPAHPTTLRSKLH